MKRMRDVGSCDGEETSKANDDTSDVSIISSEPPATRRKAAMEDQASKKLKADFEAQIKALKSDFLKETKKLQDKVDGEARNVRKSIEETNADIGKLAKKVESSDRIMKGLSDKVDNGFKESRDLFAEFLNEFRKERLQKPSDHPDIRIRSTPPSASSSALLPSRTPSSSPTEAAKRVSPSSLVFNFHLAGASTTNH